MMTLSCLTPIDLMSAVQAMAAAPAPFTTTQTSRRSPTGQIACVDEAGGGDDRRAVLVVVHDRDLHAFLQRLLDDEAVRGGNILKVDAAEARLHDLHGSDELVDILRGEFDVDRIDVGEALEQHRLAFHHRLGCGGAEIAEAEDRGSVGDDRRQGLPFAV
jgi:hypothetical protein